MKKAFTYDATVYLMVLLEFLLILDEPFVGLDPKGAWHLKQTMQEIVQNGGAIFFFAEKLCNKIAIIKRGELVTSGDI